MTWTLTDNKGNELSFDVNPRRVQELYQRWQISVPMPAESPLTLDLGIQRASIIVEGWLLSSSKANLLRQMARDPESQPVVLSGAGRYNGTYNIRDCRITERGGRVEVFEFRLELVPV